MRVPLPRPERGRPPAPPGLSLPSRLPLFMQPPASGTFSGFLGFFSTTGAKFLTPHPQRVTLTTDAIIATIVTRVVARDQVHTQPASRTLGSEIQHDPSGQCCPRGTWALRHGRPQQLRKGGSGGGPSAPHLESPPWARQFLRVTKKKVTPADRTPYLQAASRHGSRLTPAAWPARGRV